MAGNMSRCLNDITKITKLMNECQAMGIACMGPDVNESRQKFSANKKGEVRFGLGAIKGMGDAAAQAIIDEREKNGQYKDIFDFVQRVNLSAVNSKALESLVLSGAFDGFKIKRESFFARNPDGRTFLETLMRYGQVYQQEKNESRQSLFGAMEEVEIATPAIPQAESWSAIEKLNRERDLVGIYLSAHPLDEFEFILKNLCNTQCQELNDRIELSKKQEVVLGGIVTAVRSKYTKTGKPCGFVTIEDFDGSGELALFGEEWGKWRGMLIEGCTVMVKAQFVQRFRNSDMMEMRITDIQYLQTVKDTQIEKITISLEADKLDDTTVSDLVTIIKDAPGTTQLFFQVRETSNSKPFVLRSRKEKIDISKELISFIKGCEALDYKIN